MAVLSSIAFVVAMGLTIAESAAALHTCIGVLQAYRKAGVDSALTVYSPPAFQSMKPFACSSLAA